MAASAGDTLDELRSLAREDPARFVVTIERLLESPELSPEARQFWLAMKQFAESRLAR